MADLESLSDEQLLEVARYRGISTEPSGYDSYMSGAYDSPKVAMSIPRGIYSLGELATEAYTGNDQAQETLTDVGVSTGGGLGGAVLGAKAGAVLGSPLAPFTFGLSVPVGAAGGALVGGTIGSKTGEYFMDWLRGKELPTPIQARNEILYDLGTGTVLDLATAGGTKLVKNAVGLADDVLQLKKLNTEAGKAARAGKMLEKVGITDDVLAQVDEADTFGRSIAEQTNNPAAGRLERGLEKEYGYQLAQQGADARKARLDTRLGTVGEGIENSSLGRYEAGAEVYSDLAAKRAAAAKNVSDLYDAIPGDSVVAIPGMRDRISGALDRHLGEGAISLEKIDPKVEAITLDLIDNADNISIEKLQNYRRILGNEAGYDAPAGVNKDLAVSIRSAIDEEIASASGLGAATKARRSMGETYDEGAVGQILAPENKLGGRKTPDSAVVAKVLRTPESAKQFVKAGGDEARQMVADVMQSEMKDLIAADKLGAAVKKFEDSKQQLKTILTEEQFAAVEKTAKDLQSQIEFEKLITQPSRGQSGTDQFRGDSKGIKELMELDVTFAQKHPILSKVGAGVLGYAAGGMTGIPFAEMFGTIAGTKLSDTLMAGLKTADSDIARYAYKALSNKKEAARLLELAAKNDTYAAKVVTFIDTQTKATAKKLGIDIAALPSVAAEIPADVGMLGAQHRERDERTKRINAEVQRMEDLSDAQLVELARHRGLIGDSKKKLDEVVADTNRVSDGAFNRSSYKEGGAKVDLPKKVTDELLDAVRQVESGGGKYLLSPAGAEGPYQLMPATGKRIHKKLGIKEPYDPYDEKQARQIAKYHLEDGLKRFGRIDLALADYNAGHPTIKAALNEANSDVFDEIARYLPSETALYVPKIYKALKQA